ncbi:MAG: hypothetical protein II710_02010, partial [Clostridia bacterium]|nr:hypothetical protein [Clostridia bacterium]
LEPVATEADKEVLMDIYETGSFGFSKAGVISQMDLLKIEFVKVYRQSDPLFLGILDRMRVGQTTPMDIRILNARTFVPREETDGLRIVLTSTRHDAQSINENRLRRLGGDQKVFIATYTGSFKPGYADVVESELSLKLGAQVMFIKNDPMRRWVNGTLGTVVGLAEDQVEVETKAGERFEVSRAVWEKMESRYDRKTKRVEKAVVGSVSQLPLKLAWAITIHKSQSLTFDNVSIDFGKRAFGCGQAYVALSRSRTLQGLELLRPMSLSSIMVSREAVAFTRDMNDETLILREIRVGEALDQIIREQNFDGAVLVLFDMVGEALREGDFAAATDFFCRAMSLMIDDACIKGCSWMPVPANNHALYVMEAGRLFYSGKVDASRNLLENIGAETYADVNAMYILSRCYEKEERWDEVERMYKELGDLFTAYADRGQDPIIFRKIRYRWAVLNEQIYHEDGLGLMRSLLAGNPGYLRYHAAIRWMLAANAGAKAAFNESEDDSLILIGMAVDGSIPDEEFLAAIQSAWNLRDERWNAYRRFINNLKLSMVN